MRFRGDTISAVVGLFSFAAFCSGCQPSSPDGGGAPSCCIAELPEDAGDSESDAGVEVDDAGNAFVTDAGSGNPFVPGDEPVTVMAPIFGELSIIQLNVSSFIPALGESAIVVGPDGTIVLIDIGGSRHDDDVRDAIVELNTVHLTPENGFAARTQLQVDWVIITHLHGDHVGAFENLMRGPDPALDVTRGIVHRGFVDLGPAMNEDDYEGFCAAMRSDFADLDTPLCETNEIAPCAFASITHPHRATSCSGLRLGDLGDREDDGTNVPSYIELGGGARVTLVAANAHVVSDDGIVSAPPFGHTDNNEENARSIAGIVQFGDFRYHFGGDMTGAGTPTEPDIESHLVEVAGPVHYGPLGVDVTHLHHHVRRTSNNVALADALAPKDCRSRNAIGGVSNGHANSPHAETLATWTEDCRLADGYVWLTQVAPLGATHERVIDASGNVILQTVQAGHGYRIQAAGESLFSRAFPSLRSF